MWLPDVNIWLALALSGHSHHRSARAWLDQRAGNEPIVFCRATQQGLLRLLTTRVVLAPYQLEPLTNRNAWEVYLAFLGDERIDFAAEPEGVEAEWRRMALRETASPKLWMDAWLAAFSKVAGHRLISIDRGFLAFEGLNPLIVRSTNDAEAPSR